MRRAVTEFRVAAALASAALAGCGAPVAPTNHGDHAHVAAPADAGALPRDFAGFVPGGRNGLDEAKRSGRGALLFFAATW